MTDSSLNDHLESDPRINCDSTSRSVRYLAETVLTSSIATLVSPSVRKYTSSRNEQLERRTGVHAAERRLGQSDIIPPVISCNVHPIQS